jgi:acetolactate synthase-1/2/3 large subunit
MSDLWKTTHSEPNALTEEGMALKRDSIQHHYLERKPIGKGERSTRTGAKFMAETFKGYGVTHVFFVEAILRKTLAEAEALGIRRVLTHSEKAAAYMADGYARAGRKPGVCMAQSVGAANLAAGLQDARLGCSPVIALTGRKDPLYQYRHAYQEILHTPMFDPVTKFNAYVDSSEQLPFLLRQAFREATSGSPGPVHLELMGYIAQTIENAEGEWEVIIEKSFSGYPSLRPQPEADRVGAAARYLKAAERPVIVVGGGAVASSAGPEIAKLARTLSIPIATSLNGKGIIPDNHPLKVGVMGTYSRWCANKVVSEADLVIFIGTGTGDLLTNDWTVPSQGTPVIQIDIDPLELGRSYPNVVGIMGDARDTVRELLAALDPGVPRKSWGRHAREVVKAWEKEMEPLLSSNAVPIRPERLCREISLALPRNAILMADTGYSGIWTGTMVNLTRREQGYIRAAGSLGWGFPASLGAKCAAPRRPVVCFTGDGGFWYHLCEMETAVRCGIHTVTIVNNNSALGQCIVGIQKIYRDRPGKKEEMYGFSPTNFARIAEDMGCLGIRVEKPGEIAGALKKAFSTRDRPVVVDVVTDASAHAPWTPPS